MTALECFKCGGDHMARDCKWMDQVLAPAAPPRTCRACGGTGCARDRCAQCGVPRAHHTDAGRTECAWRGQPCETCGKPPHPDWHAARAASYVHPSDADIPAARLHLMPGPERCERYTHPDDTPERRAIRESTPWRRMTDPAGFYVRHA